MDVKITETLTINGVEVELNQQAAQLRTNFKELITAVREGAPLSNEQKAYVADLLEEQMEIEVQTAVMLDPSMHVEDVLDQLTVFK